MRASKRNRNPGSNTPTIVRTSILPDDIKVSIASIVRSFGFGPQESGTCMARAVIADAVFRACGLNSRLTAGGLLFRAGRDPVRDTLRFCLPNINMGGYFEGWLVGHIWNEIDGEIADFSAGDWIAESVGNALSDLGKPELGFVEWEAEPPQFIWQPARSLKHEWKPHGVPRLGHIWYGSWRSSRKPDFGGYSEVSERAAPHIDRFVVQSQLHERIADCGYHRPSFQMAA